MMIKDLKKIALVGLSGIGMPILNLMIRMFSVSIVYLVDDDVWEEKQMLKHIFSRKKHVGEVKVVVGEQQVKEFDDSIEVIKLENKFQDKTVKSELKNAEIIIGAVDNVEARVDMMLFAVENRKVLLDVSAEIINDERFATVRIYIPGKTPCLACQGLNLKSITTKSLKEQRIKAGYFNNSEKKMGSVSVLDTAIATIGLTLLEGYINNEGDLPTTISLNQSRHEFKKLYFTKHEDCNICNVLEKEAERCRK